MVPSCSPDSQTVKKPPKPTNLMRMTLNSIEIHFSSHPRFWLFIAFFWAQALIISIARNPPPCFPDRSSAVPVPFSAVCYVPVHDDAVSNATALPEAPPAQYTDECPSGRVYAYDLPSAFNRDLVVPNCTDLDPWNWECGIISNHGYGRAATELCRAVADPGFCIWGCDK